MKYIIAGLGLEGQAAKEYFSKLPDTEEILVLESDAQKPFVDQLPADYQNWTIIRSPSIRPDKFPPDAHIWSPTNEFFAKCPAPIIGVTGTKGKGSTASFIAEILRSAGKTVHLVGNIGQPAVNELNKIKPGDAVVYELSSFQLWDIQKSPHIAVLTILEPDHLNVHKNMAEYTAAKANIVKFQTANDFVVYKTDEPVLREIAENSPAQKLPYPDQTLYELVKKSVQLPGEHQLLNAEAAVLAARAHDPEISDADIARGLSNFTGLPHRLKLVREVNGVKYYDDSISTTPGSAAAALRSFTEPKILILGGSDKGADYGVLGPEIARANVKQIFAMGTNGDKIQQQISEHTDRPVTRLTEKKMSEIVNIVAQSARPGDIVIMSPAAASFDMFRDYKDRGEQFVAAVQAL
jgi:UDP-N-acetylmuramoylalanine--D-glutamate ligase